MNNAWKLGWGNLEEFEIRQEAVQMDDVCWFRTNNLFVLLTSNETL